MVHFILLIKDEFLEAYTPFICWKYINTEQVYLYFDWYWTSPHLRCLAKNNTDGDLSQKIK